MHIVLVCSKKSVGSITGIAIRGCMQMCFVTLAAIGSVLTEVCINYYHLTSTPRRHDKVRCTLSRTTPSPSVQTGLNGSGMSTNTRERLQLATVGSALFATHGPITFHIFAFKHLPAFENRVYRFTPTRYEIKWDTLFSTLNSNIHSYGYQCCFCGHMQPCWALPKFPNLPPLSLPPQSSRFWLRTSQNSRIWLRVSLNNVLGMSLFSHLKEKVAALFQPCSFFWAKTEQSDWSSVRLKGLIEAVVSREGS